jgi:hypothetical protein
MGFVEWGGIEFEEFIGCKGLDAVYAEVVEPLDSVDV